MKVRVFGKFFISSFWRSVMQRFVLPLVLLIFVGFLNCPDLFAQIGDGGKIAVGPGIVLEIPYSLRENRAGGNKPTAIDFGDGKINFLNRNEVEVEMKGQKRHGQIFACASSPGSSTYIRYDNDESPGYEQCNQINQEGTKKR